MHEYSVAANIVDMVLEKSQGRRVEKVNLSVGALSGIFTESLTMYLILILEEKGHLGVKIAAQTASAAFKCACGEEYTAKKMTDACPSCGGYNRLIIWGKDCVVESIEVNDD